MNNQVDILPSASRTATPTATRVTNPDCKFAHVVLDVTVNAGGLGSITLSIYGRDKASGKRYLLLASAAVTAVATTIYKIGPGLTAAANAVANDVVPKELEIEVVHGNANPIAYSVGLNLIG